MGATQLIGLFLPPPSHKFTQLCVFDISLHLATPHNAAALVSWTSFVTVHTKNLLRSPLSSSPVFCMCAWTGGLPSQNTRKGYIWCSSTTLLFLETHAPVVDSLRVTLLCVTNPSSPINDYSATIHIPKSPTTSHSSSSHSSSLFTPLPSIFLTIFNSPPLWLTVSLLPVTLPSLSCCIWLPLSLLMLSSCDSTTSLFLCYYSVPSYSTLSSQKLQPSSLVVLGPIHPSRLDCN